MSDKTAIWDRLSITDPTATKAFKKAGGFRGTDVNPTWRMRRMTEEFGPVGLGWGWTITARWSETLDGKDCVFVQLHVWYSIGGDPNNIVHTGEQIGGTVAERTPDEAYKMAVTDAVGKCCVQLGLAADVYLGQFDDAKYVRQCAEHYKGNQGPEEPPADPAVISDWRARIDMQVKRDTLRTVIDEAKEQLRGPTLESVLKHGRARWKVLDTETARE